MACQRVLSPGKPADRGFEVALEPASVGDIPLLVDLDRRCFGARCWSVSAWSGAVHDRQCVTVVARLAGRLIGAMVVLGDRPVASLASIAVERAHRGRGVGSRLLRRAIEVARSSAARWLSLEVDADAEAVSFYRAAGFVVTGRFREDGRDRLTMAKRLGGHYGR